MKLVVDATAEVEFAEALDWYETQREGLGARFDAAIHATMMRIVGAPHSFPSDPWEPRAKSLAVVTFPYRVVFVPTPEEVRVVAFAHTKRKPGYWAARLPTA